MITVGISKYGLILPPKSKVLISIEYLEGHENIEKTPVSFGASVGFKNNTFYRYSTKGEWYASKSIAPGFYARPGFFLVTRKIGD